jgi:hypothetical protein
MGIWPSINFLVLLPLKKYVSRSGNASGRSCCTDCQASSRDLSDFNKSRQVSLYEA